MSADSSLSILQRLSATRVLVLGDVMLDRYVYGSVERISPEAPIPIMAVDRELDMPGGAANVARNAASLGAAVTLIGVVGEDIWAQDLRSQLATMPSIESHLIADASRPTTRKTRFIAERQQLLRADREHRVSIPHTVRQRALEAFQRALPNVSAVVLSDYAKGVLSDTLIRAVIDAARGAGKVVIVDPKSRSLDRYAGCTVLTPNRQELELACGHPCASDDSVVAAARTFIDRGVCEAMVITRGAAGLTVVTAGGRADHLPAQVREVFDVSGAGDTVIAALSLGLAAGGDMVGAASVANVAAGLVVAKLGTAVVTSGEVAAALAQYDGRADRGKLFTLEHVLQLAQNWRAQGHKIAFANGCFDLLHTGHLSLLEQARRAGDRLIVGLNSDLSVRQLKGAGRPVRGEVERATILSSLKTVDAVVIFPEETPARLIDALQPDVLVKGADYSIEQVVGAETVLKRGGRVLLIDLVPDQSTSATLARVAAGSAAP